MRWTSRQHGTAILVTLAGRATGDDSVTLRASLDDLQAQGHRRVIVDLTELEYLDSAALGELVACQVRAVRMGAPLKLANPDARLRELLGITRLTTVFETYGSVDAAMESFEDAAQRE